MIEKQIIPPAYQTVKCAKFEPTHSSQPDPKLFYSFTDPAQTLIQTKEGTTQQTFSQRYWPLVALLGGVSFSLHNLFFFSSTWQATQSGLGAAVLLPYWIGELPFVVALYGYQILKNYSKTGSFWSKSTSKYYMATT